MRWKTNVIIHCYAKRILFKLKKGTKMYGTIEFFADLYKAVERYYVEDVNLLNSRMERPSVFRIAHYLATLLEEKKVDYRVDCEVHKGPSGRKRIYFPEDDAVYTCRPDLIVHKLLGLGLAMVEFKTTKNDTNDERKLKFFTVPDTWYDDKPWLRSVKINYEIGVFVCLNQKLPIFKIYKDGKKLNENEARKVLNITDNGISIL